MSAEEVKNVVIDPLLKDQTEDKYGYRNEPINYVNQGQIMVTITLAEYRSLVKANADKKVEEANSKVYEAHKERDELKKQVEDLQKQLDALKAMIAGAANVQLQMNQAKEPDND